MSNNDNRSKYVLKKQQYSDLMDNVFKAFNPIPIINDLHSSKQLIPVFEEIKKERTDSVEIKNFPGSVISSSWVITVIIQRLMRSVTKSKKNF